jgi:hypothetical protein
MEDKKVSLNLWEKIKKEFKNDYFKLTFYYLAVYAVASMVLVYGIDYLKDGDLNYGNLKDELTIVTISFMLTMATMFKKLKDDIVTNYWKQQRQINSRRKK